MKQIDLNCDMGESYGVYSLGMDPEVIWFISSANIACGFHAGDPHVMGRTVRLAVSHGVAVGAHPGFPDRLGFGRRVLDCTPAEIRDFILYQVGALRAFCTFHDAPLQHVKPHGSLYTMAARNENILHAIGEAVSRVDRDLLLVMPAGKDCDRMASIGREEGVKILFEAFPDRAYTPDGSLAPRKWPGSVIHDPEEVAERALRMVQEGVVAAQDGSLVPLEPQTLCIHGDTPGAVDLARSIRERLVREGITPIPMGRHGHAPLPR